MKNILALLLLVVATLANAQTKQPSLKELLYRGKLKADSSGVIRKDDDLSTKIDTTTKVAKPAVVKSAPVTVDTGRVVAPLNNSAASDAAVTDAVSASAAPVTAPAAPAKTNTRIWKEYTDTLISTLKAEVLTSKKIKKDTYFVTVDYEIDTNGSVNILNVVSTPENATLQYEVKNRLEATPPQLAPVLDSTKQPRKVKRKHNFSVTKE